MSRRPPASDDTENGFLSRWSRRKAGLDDSETAAPANDAGATDNQPGPQPERPRAPDAADPSEPAEAERVKTDADMPDLDLIDETTDMSDFFSSGVSEELRNRALRRLFRMSKFNVTDGLDDYNENFRDFALLGDIVTSDMRHRTEMEAERRAAQEADPPSADEQAVADAGEETTASDEPAESTPAADRDPAAGGDDTDPDSDPHDARPESPERT